MHEVALQIGQGVLLILEALERAKASRMAAQGEAPSSSLPEWLTTAEAAALARRTSETIREWVRAGRLKDVGDGRPLYRREDVEAALRRPRATRAKGARKPKRDSSTKEETTPKSRAEQILRAVE